jgi:hypothetical protein
MRWCGRKELVADHEVGRRGQSGKVGRALECFETSRQLLNGYPNILPATYNSRQTRLAKAIRRRYNFAR